MVFFYVLTAWLGSLLTILALRDSCGVLVAITVSPFGGSALTVGAAVCVYLWNAPRTSSATHARPGAHRGWSRAG